MKHFFFISFTCFFTTIAFAQSRKELLIQKQILEQTIIQLQKDNNRQKQELDTLNKEIALLYNQVEILENEKEELQQNIIECNAGIEDYKVQLRRRVEVYDLYSFGYQPLKNSIGEYETHLKITQKAIETARWKNVEDLLVQLKSKKISEEQKLFLFNNFLLLYPSFSVKTITEFITFSITINTELKGIIQQQTQKELKSIIKENLWIQTLEEGWNINNNSLVKKYQ